jgi:hypothetical protein
MSFRWAWIPVAAASLAGGAWAQEKPPAVKPEASPSPRPPEAERGRRGERVNRVISLKNRELLEAFKTILGPFAIGITTSRELGVITLSGQPEAVAAAEEVIRRFDLSPAAGRATRNLAFTAHLLVARQQAGTGSPLPAELTPVIEQFRGVLAYKAYELLDTLTIRIVDDRRADTNVEGLVRWPQGAALPARTHLRIRNAKIVSEDEKGRSIQIPSVMVKVELPITVSQEGKQVVEYRATSIETGLDIREGQKVVVGKASFDGTSDALILVLKAEVEG